MSETSPTGEGDTRLQLRTELDRAALRRQRRRSARRPTTRADLWWIGTAAVGSALGWALVGFSVVWLVGLLGALLFAVGALLEQRAVTRQLSAIPESHRRRTITIGDRRIRVTADDGTVLVDTSWREVGAVDRDEDGYTIELPDGVIDVPMSAFPTAQARGSFEALAARNDRPIQHGA